MRKHAFTKEDCKCFRKATYFVCRHCGARLYLGADEVRRLKRQDAVCPSPEAPRAEAEEAFKGMLGGTFDCFVEEEQTVGSS